MEKDLSSAAERLGADHRLLREITDLLPAYVAYVDADLRYVAANQMYVDRFGRDEHNIVGRLVADVTGGAFENVAGHLRAALRGKTQRFETKMISIEGDRTLAVSHLPHRGAQGDVVGVIVYGYDITEQRQAEAALLQNEKLAAVGRLASSLAHEINNPLEAIVNLLYLIENTGEQDLHQIREYAAQAQKELARVTQITTNTLGFFRQSTKQTTVDAVELMEAVLTLYASRLANCNIELIRDFQAGVSLVCYDGEIRQVLHSLLSNAVDALRSGGRLQVRVRRTDGGVRIAIADSGYGMSPTVQACMFEPFFTTKGIMGTGLSLWIAQQLTSRHHGHLHVRSQEGRGTVVALALPEQQLKD